MKRWPKIFLSFICPFFVVACDRDATNNASQLSLPPASASKPATAGGYEPTGDERVPGITMSQEELDRIYTEARRNMPVPVIPQDASTQDQH